MKSRVLFLMEHKGPENASSLRDSFDTWIKPLHGIEFSDILRSSTFVTDCTSIVLYIVGASSSSQKVPFCERQIGCVSHQFNTAMRKVMIIEKNSKSNIASNVSHVKNIVKMFKKTRLNTDMPQRLVQEM